MLTDTKILELWKAHLASKEMAGWWKGYAPWLREFMEMPDDVFLLPDTQRRLWDDRYAGTLSWADTARDFAPLHTDAALAQLLLQTRNTVWPENIDERAAALQARFDEVLSKAKVVAAGYAFARVSRVFAALTPRHTHAGYVRSKTLKINEALLGDAFDQRPHEGRVRGCARLQALVGRPETADEIVRQSTFFWRVYLHVTKASAEATPSAPSTTGTAVTDASSPDIERAELPPLDPLPYPDQFRGMFPISGLVATVVEVLDAVQQNGDRHALVAALVSAPGNEGTTEESWAPFLARLVGLDLLHRDGDTYSVTSSAQPVLAGDLAPIARAMLERVYGLAQLLRITADAPSGIPVASAFGKLRTAYPAWKTDRMPNSLLGWLRSLGLVERKDGRLRITEHGIVWSAALPRELPGPVLPGAAMLPGPSATPATAAAPAWTRPGLADLRQRFAEDPITKRFVFPDADLASLHHAWHALPGKRFVLLSGLSGTGKTQLLEQYARHYLHGLDADKHLALVPVSPDWRDEGGLVGWRNPLAGGTFVRGAALDLLLRASEDVDGLPYFLILDEMNLARVERYFAPILSAMETGRPIRVHTESDDVDGVPSEIPWPTNLFVGGTVNVDESTYPFSDKVLDRAFTFEFWEVDLPGFFARAETRDAELEALLLGLQEALRPARRHFGYRTAKEIVAFVTGAAAGDRAVLLDRAVLAKILPKLRGEEGDGVRNALERVRQVCSDAKLAHSVAKCDAMLQRLAHAGMTGFF